VRVRRPHETIARHLRAIVFWMPALDQSRIEIDNPILGNACALIAPPLELAIVSRRRRREDLHDEAQFDDVAPIAEPRSGSGPINEQIGLEDLVVAERDIGGRAQDSSDSGFAKPWV